VDLWVDIRISEENTASIFRTTNPHDVSIQKTNIDIFSAVRTEGFV
jgi:hypothetical protein